MLKIPLGFKGPKNQLQALFSEDLAYKATVLLLDNALTKWHHKQQLELITAVIESDNDKQRLSINWPLSSNNDEPIGSCDCKNPKPCVHLAALAIESKTRLDQLPPFTQQIQASKNIAETFSNWMVKQTHDPYPNMARHRLIYLLDYDEIDKAFTISMHKAYLSTEDRYTLKSEVDSTLIDSTVLPKFISLADQKILQILFLNSDTQQHSFNIHAERDQLVLTEILLTNRCFWKACYRTPLEFSQDVTVISPSSKKIINNIFLSIQENSVVSKSQVFSQAISVDVRKVAIVPHLTLNSYEFGVQAKQMYYFDVDVAKVSFKHADKEFSFADLSSGKIIPESMLLEQMAGFLRQIESLNSVFAHYEKTVLADFHLNDRFIEADFSAIACLLRGLQLDNWKITIADNFRLNQQSSDDWYAQVKSSRKKQLNTSNNDWFDLELGVKIDGREVNLLPYLVKALKSGKIDGNTNKSFSIKLDNGENIGINNNSLKQILSTITELYDETSLNKEKQLTMPSSQLLRINQLQELLNENSNSTLKWQGDDWLKQKTQELNSALGLTDIPTPKNLKVELRNYQQTGFSWLQFLNKHHLGGILADDMGLGKTLQILTHILHEKNTGKLKSPCLIVVPTSLLSNWQNEINKFTPTLSSLVLTGTSRHSKYQNISTIDVIIISYGVMVRDNKKLAEFNFHMLILDEAQAIKNAKTRNAKVARTLVAKQKLCLTGTPIENHLGELWSLFDFLMLGFLGTQKQFEKIYRIPIEKNNDEDRQIALSKRVAPFMLRRTKSEVAKELPDKTEIVQLIELNETQANLYETIRLTMSDEIKQVLRKSQGGKNNIIIGNALLRLRQICCHPALLKLAAIENYESAKLNWLTTVLPNMVEEGRRILLFSSFTTMLDIIEEHLLNMGITSLKLTGKTPSSKRGALIDKFQDGQVPVFLISLKAGGAGINLTAADTVIHFDPWWNPAAESQASDRAHRIGQEKNVFVYKLITKGTVEQKIQKMQQHKHELAQSIFDQKGNISTILGDKNWQELLKPIE